MSTTPTRHRNETGIVVDPALPTIVITREFEAPPERVFRAHTDPDLVAQWLGPRGLTMTIDRYDARTDGSYRYVHADEEGNEYAFHGVFHEVRPAERIVQTFTYEGMPDSVSLETAVFEDLGGRTRLTATSLLDSLESRDGMIASGAETGIREGYERLDAVLDGTQAAEEHRRIAAGFTARVRGAEAGRWDDPAPCEGWVARDVVRHLVEWFPGFLKTGAGIELPEGPSVDDDPVAAWQVHNDAVQSLLDDPATAGRTLSHPQTGDLPLAQAIDRFYTSDVFMHTWDLARATGQDEHLDPAKCAALLAGMLPMDEVLRGSGHYGPRVEVPESADVQTRLLAFTGRTP
ncbi:hypothetical protein AA958_24450 [Streptomyces sp. CNQ-509]|uniref:TIGR03086 family metal-binding protein n=1 Tax=unclassified Streptomyces TaxID=2593676 RepID=UPI00062DD5C6|nr:TIGR03086 family metal-binding protein [Streptomyces sp. CNQ-509]AKH84839.1 hypothetical protein AA958_24450 [Streptomyces sp. CNQ-509]